MSTAKSMATLYLNNKRNSGNNQQATRSSTLTLAGNQQQQQRFKSSTSNLASAGQTGGSISSLKGANKSTRAKSTSMTNLLVSEEGRSGQNQANASSSGSRIQRPVSRNALDSIHNGMNAKYAQVQSKVYLQNIKPTTASKIPSSAAQTHAASTSPAPQQQQLKRPAHIPGRAAQATSTSSRVAALAAERAQFAARVQELEEELKEATETREREREELDRERQEKIAEIERLKVEIQNRAAEQERQNEEYHQKLLEAYELADQNRRATDSVLSESRQRDEEARKRAEELESQLAELREFVAMKEEMTGKMFELREQIREERERYEQQLKSLRQLFDNEKISSVRLDENSNYFNRLKPTLESCESINKQSIGLETTSTPPRSPNRGTGCRQCQSGSTRQLHKSEQDIYGSKMSTRMQDSAKSAWKASKQFASSVITGGVGLSSCRQCTKRKSSPSPPPSAFSGPAAQQLPPHPVSRCNSGRKVFTSGEQQEQHTSVIQVGHGEQNQQQPHSGNNSLEMIRKSGSVQLSSDAHKEPASLIRVDENNKLTIVTKFNDSNNNNISEGSSTIISSGGSSSASAPTSDSIQSPGGSGGSGSERSRCESSSSGRGTASDAGSAASQNGDSLDVPAGPDGATPPSSAQEKQRGPEKRHKRRSSLFKASKMFGGSQTSLGKLRSFFSSSSANSMKIEQTEQHVSIDHLESSRIRCLELNQALQVGSLTLGLDPNGLTQDDNIDKHQTKIINNNVNDHSLTSIVATSAADKRQQVGQGNPRGTLLQPPPSTSANEEDKQEQVAASDKQQQQQQQQQQRAGNSVIAASA